MTHNDLLAIGLYGAYFGAVFCWAWLAYAVGQMIWEFIFTVLPDEGVDWNSPDRWRQLRRVARAAKCEFVEHKWEELPEEDVAPALSGIQCVNCYATTFWWGDRQSETLDAEH